MRRSLPPLFLILFLSAAAWARPQLQWEAWYIVTVEDEIPYAYSQDLVESRDGKLHFQNRLWKMEEGFINEESLGAFAENSSELTPLFFNFHSNYRASELDIDGTIENGRKLIVRVRRSGKDLPIIRRALPPKTFLSGFFPVWLKLHGEQLPPGKSRSFTTLFEDSLDTQFRLAPCTIKRDATDPKRFAVDLRGVRSHWWLDGDGIVARIEMPARRMVITRSTAEKARHFLTQTRSPKER